MQPKNVRWFGRVESFLNSVGLSGRKPARLIEFGLYTTTSIKTSAPVASVPTIAATAERRQRYRQIRYVDQTPTVRYDSTTGICRV